MNGLVSRIGKEGLRVDDVPIAFGGASCRAACKYGKYGDRLLIYWRRMTKNEDFVQAVWNNTNTGWSTDRTAFIVPPE